MIQRIQSLYLFLSAAILGLMFVFPISRFYGDLHTFELNLLKVKNLVPGAEDVFQAHFTYPLAAGVVIIALIAFASIFMFKNRKKQMKAIKVGILLNVILIVAVFFVYSRLITDQVNVAEEYESSAFYPLVSLVGFILAYRGVKKDDTLVRSADRLR